MAEDYKNGIKVDRNVDIDLLKGPYRSIAEANAKVTPYLRSISGTTGLKAGRTVIIDDGTTRAEYWWDGGTTDAHLVAKSTGGGTGTITSVNGQTGPVVVLTSTDTGSIPVTDKGIASGIGTLNGSGKQPMTEAAVLTTPTPVNTPVVAGMNPQQTAEALQGQMDNTKKLRGAIYSKLPVTGDYVKTGSATTATYGAGGVTLSGGNNDSLNYIEFDSYVTCPTNWSRRILFKPSVSGAGVGIGLNSTNGKIIGRIALGGANDGKLLIDTYRSAVTTNRVTSATAITYSPTDTLELYFERSFMYYRLVVRNLTTPANLSVFNIDPCDFSIQFSVWNAAKPAIYHYGGTQLVSLDEYSVNEFLQNRLLIYGNSILGNAYSSSLTGSAYALLKGEIADGVTLIAGGGNTTNDYVKLRTEIKSLKPRIIIWGDGINDLISGVSLATTQANITTFINDCYDIKATPVICKVLPVGASTVGTGTHAQLVTDINTLNTWIDTLTVRIVNMYPAFVGLTANTLNPAFNCGDDLHLSAAGQNKYYEELVKQIPDLLNIKKVQWNKIGFVDFTTTRSLLASDFSSYDIKMLRGGSASTILFTIPPDTELITDVGSQVLVRQSSTGQISFIAGSGVTIKSSFTRRITAAQDSVVCLVKEAANIWTLTGDLTT